MKLAVSLTLMALFVTPTLAIAGASEGELAAEFPAAVRLMPGTPARVELTNTGNQPITAWSFSVSTPTATGAHHENYQADVYLSEVTANLPGAAPHLDRIMPGQSRALPVDAVATDAKVELKALVLQDGTAVGDPEVIKKFFDHRASERDQLRAVAEAFRTVLASKKGAAALTELKQQFQAAAGDSVPHRTAREAVDALLKNAQAGNEEEADRSIRRYAEVVAKQYDAAVAHSRRKP